MWSRAVHAWRAAGADGGGAGKGARGGGGPETERGGPGVPSTDTAADKQESHRLQKQPVPQTDPVEDGRTDGAVGLFLFMSYRGVLPLTAAEGVRLQAAWVWVKPAFSQRLQASAAINNVYVFTTDVSLYGHIWPLCVRACCLHWPSAIMFTRLQRMCECVCARVFVVLQNAARTWPSKESPVQTTSFSCELCSTVFVHLSICQCGDHWVLGSEDIYTYWGHFGFYLSTELFWGFKFIPHTKKESLLMFALWIPPLLAEEKQVWSHFRNSQSDVTSFLK